MKYIIKKMFYNFLTKLSLKKDSLKIYWFRKNDNFGDILNLALIEKLTTKKVDFIKIKYYSEDHYLCIGSLLASCRKNTIVWGGRIYG